MNKIEEHRNLCEKLTEIYKAKNNDYGDSFGKSVREYGFTAALVRMEDKFNRLKTLLRPNANQQVKNESIHDTLLDLANYALMTDIEISSLIEEKQL